MTSPDWPAAVDSSVLGRLSSEAREVLLRSPVPALVPSDAPFAERAKLTAGAHFFAVSSRADGVTVSVHATRVSHRWSHLPPARPNRSVRGAPAIVTANEGIWTATWLESGVTYALDLECDVVTDGRCADATALLGIAERLGYVGGAR